MTHINEVPIERVQFFDPESLEWLMSAREYVTWSAMGIAEDRYIHRDVPVTLTLYLDSTSGVAVWDVPAYERGLGLTGGWGIGSNSYD